MRSVGTLLLGLVFGAGCSGIAANYDYDADADFSRLETYRWVAAPKKEVSDDLARQRVKAAAEAELAAKGYEHSPGNPDFLIAIHIGHERRIQVDQWGYDYGPRSHGGGGRARMEVYEYDEGTLILDMVDAKTKRLLWRGTATAVVNPDLTPEKRTELINEAVGKVLEKFPPPPKP